MVESIPGVAEGTRWLGTFDRDEAVQRETLDFFASGHPLVEGVLVEIEDGHRGQIALLEVHGTGVTGAGVLAMVKRGAEFEALVVDIRGRRHPEWARFFTEERGARREGDPLSWGLAGPEAMAAWAPRARELLHPLQREGKLVAAAAFRLLPD